MPDFSDILKRIDAAIEKFNKVIPGIQKSIFADIQEELKRLDTTNGKIKTTVANIKIITSIKNKLLRLILTPEYKAEVKDFAQAFNDVTKLQNQYWQSVEKTFKPRPLLKEIRTQAIADTVKSLTASGIGSTIQEQVADILRTNITTGGSYADLNDQLRESLVNTKTDGLLLKYTKQITVDAIHQYNRQYTQTVSNDLGFEWYSYQGSEIMTSRPFCQAMVENNRYFHVSQIPNLLRGLDAEGNRLKYIDNKTQEEKSVTIYDRTKLPYGFISGTNVANFLINLGGYSCGHAGRPVSESLVPLKVREIVFATAAYKSFKSIDHEENKSGNKTLELEIKNDRVMHNGEDVGLINTTKISSKIIEIDKLYLKKENQSKGIGRKVMEDIFLKNPGVEEIRVYPLASSEPFWARYAERIDAEGNNFITRASLAKRKK